MVSSFRLALSTGNQDINDPDLTWLKGSFLNSLVRTDSSNDTIIAINEMLLYFMREHAFQMIASECFDDLCDD